MIYRRLLPFIRRPSATFVGANVNSSTGTRLAAYHIQNYWLQPKKHFSFLVSAKNFEFYSLRPQSTFQEEQLILDIGSEDDFDEHVLHSNKPVIASFYADWCGPCQNLAPRLAAKVVGQQGKILLVKINIEEGATLAEQYGISAVPTIVCFRHGEEVHRFEGDVDDHYLDEIMSSVMLKEEGLDKNPGGRIVPDEGDKENR